MARIGNRQHGALGEVERQNALFEEREKRQELKHILHMKTNGKSICATTPKECHFEGDCNGTCPACEAEVRYLEHQLSLLRKAGKAATVMGVAVGMTMVAGCKQGSNNTPSVTAPGTEQPKRVGTGGKTCPTRNTSRTDTSLLKNKNGADDGLLIQGEISIDSVVEAAERCTSDPFPLGKIAPDKAENKGTAQTLKEYKKNARKPR